MADRDRWIVHIKALRSKHGLSILEAERLALSDAHWRRWVEHQINADDQCRKMALYHMRTHGEGALLYEDGNVLKVR